MVSMKKVFVVSLLIAVLVGSAMAIPTNLRNTNSRRDAVSVAGPPGGGKKACKVDNKPGFCVLKSECTSYASSHSDVVFKKDLPADLAECKSKDSKERGCCVGMANEDETSSSSPSTTSTTAPV